MIWYLSVLQNSQLPVNLSSNSGVLYEEDKKGHSFLSSFACLGPDFEKNLADYFAINPFSVYTKKSAIKLGPGSCVLAPLTMVITKGVIYIWRNKRKSKWQTAEKL